MSQTTFVCPPRTATEENRLAWLKEALREGETYIRNSTAFADFKRGKEIIAGLQQNKIPEQLSRINVNLQKRLIRDVVATMSNLRPLWGYSTDNKDLDQQAEVLNKLLVAWYQSTFADQGIKKGLQYGGVFGTGWIGPDWKSDFWVRGRGDIVVKAYSPEDVIPCQLPADMDIQRAYAVTIREEVPINLARAMFPTMAGKLVPDRQAPSGLKKGFGRMTSFLSPVLNRFAADQKSRKVVDTVFPVVDIYNTYILDLSVNEGPTPQTFGEPGTYWNYTVPVLGSDIPDGTNAQGQPVFRKATPEDSMLYPFRRLVTWCNGGVLRDDTSYWWHAMVPLAPLYFDDWAWEFLGYSMTRDLDSIEQSSNTLRRAMDDSANARMRPALMHDDRTIGNSLMESLDVRQPGQSVGVDLTVSERPIRPILEPQYYDVPPWIPAVIQSNDEMMKYISGVNDFTAIAKARQIPSSDSIEKIMDMSGPIVTSISRGMESSLGRLGEMIKCLFFEFYQAPRRLQILGPDGLTPEDTTFYEPGNMIPSHLPHEDTSKPSNYTQVERARRFMNSFFFKITPNSLHQITQMSRKLLYIQLQKAGIPIDPWTMASINDIPNFGPPPAGTTTVFERWVAFEKLKGDLTAHIQAKAMEIQAQSQMKIQLGQAALVAAAQGGAPQPGPGQYPGPAGPPGPSPALGQQGPGRPPEFQGSPVIEQKDGGTRSTITSK